MRNLIIGCGYLGLRVSLAWKAQGAAVRALTRSSTRAAELAAMGIEPIIADVTQPDSLRALSQLDPPDCVLYALGYDPAAGHSRRAVQIEGLAHALDCLPTDTRRLVFTSTTSVYGQSDGQWVDEETPPCPVGAAAEAALEAERVLTAHRLGARAIVMRLAGIYGPGRLPRAAALAQSEPLALDPRSRLNLIHVDDAVAAVLAAATYEAVPALFLISDGHPCRRGEFYEELARQIGAATPRFVPAGDEAPHAGNARAKTVDDPQTPRRAPRSVTDKQVCNARMLAELGITLRYPTFRAGLAASASNTQASSSPGKRGSRAQRD